MQNRLNKVIKSVGKIEHSLYPSFPEHLSAGKLIPAHAESFVYYVKKLKLQKLKG